jgi:hypothetical protein
MIALASSAGAQTPAEPCDAVYDRLIESIQSKDAASFDATFEAHKARCSRFWAQRSGKQADSRDGHGSRADQLFAEATEGESTVDRAELRERLAAIADAQREHDQMFSDVLNLVVETAKLQQQEHGGVGAASTAPTVSNTAGPSPASPGVVPARAVTPQRTPVLQPDAQAQNIMINGQIVSGPGAGTQSASGSTQPPVQCPPFSRIRSEYISHIRCECERRAGQRVSIRGDSVSCVAPTGQVLYGCDFRNGVSGPGLCSQR